MGLLALTSISVQAQGVEPKGELRIYPRATQIGTVANREFKDHKGRVIKVIYYTYTGIPETNFSEERLREQSSRTYEYDEYSCPVKSESYDQQRNLIFAEEVRCVERTATPSLTTVRNPQGIKQRETRHTDTGSAQTVLQFDSSGEKVIGIIGELPRDTDLLHGWGNVVHGLALGIASIRERGPQQDLEVYVTVKNIDNGPGIAMISPIEIELKDAGGQVIQESSPQFNQPQQSGECPTYLKMGVPRQGLGLILYSLNLRERFNPLPPGKYSLTLTYCVSEKPERLVSNTIQIEVN